MHILIPAATLVLCLGTAIVHVLRSFFTRNKQQPATSPAAEVCWRDYRPLHRLLDPADFDFLRSQGVPEIRIKRMRAERRKIYRTCLRSLAADFDLVHMQVNLLLIQSHVDRPELAAELARQRLAFHRNLMRAKFRLMLHACGFERMPAIELLQPLEVLQSELRQLATVGAPA